MGRRRGVELYRAPFPLYALRVDPKTGLLIAAGGGGAAKTGIKNGVVRTQGPRGTGHAVAGGRFRGGWEVGRGGGMQGWTVPLLWALPISSGKTPRRRLGAGFNLSKSG